MRLTLRDCFCVMALSSSLAKEWGDCVSSSLAKDGECADHAVYTVSASDGAQRLSWMPGSVVQMTGVKSPAVGDTITFWYGTTHDVMKMSDNTCGADGNTELATNSVGGGKFDLVNKYTYTVTSADQTAGTIYFSCSYPSGTYGHCGAGQKLTVTVKGGTTTGTTATTGASGTTGISASAQSMFGYAGIPLAA